MAGKKNTTQHQLRVLCQNEGPCYRRDCTEEDWFTTLFLLVGDPVADRGRNRGRAEEDARAGVGVAAGTSGSQDAADGAAGLHRDHSQPGN